MICQALGPNGYVVISGYDLYPDTNNMQYNTPAEYKVKLARQVGQNRNNVL
jgi:hypothetical protein